MKKFIPLFLIFLFSTTVIGQPYLQWAKNMGGIGSYSEVCNSIKVDDSGNTYLIGYFNYTSDFNPGPGIDTLVSSGSWDIFFSKFDVNGNFLWAKSIGSSEHDEGYDIDVDSTGNVYIIGTFKNTVDFDPGAGVTSLTSSGWEDLFFAKYDPNGNFIWANKIGGSDNDEGFGIAVSNTNDVFVTGYFADTVDFDPGLGIANLFATLNNSDIFIAKYDSNGNYIWANGIGGTSYDFGKDLVLDELNNVYITGSFKNTADFNPGVGIANLSSSGDLDVFFAKYDSNGNYVWAKSFGGLDIDKSNCINIDYLGNIYLTGRYEGTVDFDPGLGTVNQTSLGGLFDLYFAKFNPSGNYIWAKTVGSSSFNEGHDLEIDSVGNLYLTGEFTSTADFNPSSGTSNLTSSGGRNIFVAKYNSNGSYIWARRIGENIENIGYGIELDNLENIYVSGMLNGTADFDLSPDTFNLFATSNDVFLAKYSQECTNYIIDTALIENTPTLICNTNNAVYQWLDCNNGYSAIIGETNQSFTATSNGSYAVQITDFGCIDTSSCYYISSIGINESSINNHIIASPNPTTGQITISLEERTPTTITLRNSLGQHLLSEKHPSSNEVVFDISSYPTGMYFLKLEMNGIVITKKVVKE